MWLSLASVTISSFLKCSLLFFTSSFEKAGFSIAETQKVLTSIASDVLVDEGQVVNAFEAFWTPGDGKEVLTSRDIIADFPELVTL